jgi:hypothetical protein
MCLVSNWKVTSDEENVDTLSTDAVRTLKFTTRIHCTTTPMYVVLDQKALK